MNNKVSDNNFIKNGMKSDMPLYTISVVSELLGTTNQTLRLYEKHNLIKPYRKNKNRLYSENDIRWLFCIREIIHNKKISIEGLKKLLNYAPCWEIKDCPEDKRRGCMAYKYKIKDCWEIKKASSKDFKREECSRCIFYVKSKKSCNFRLANK